MKEELKIFMESSLLEEYLLGITDDSQTAEVERMLETYPEVKEEYVRMQADIESFCAAYAQKPPSDLKAFILDGIEEKIEEPTESHMPHAAEMETPIVPMARQGMNWMTAAASIVALIAISAAVYFWNQQQTLVAELGTAKKERAQIAAQLEQLNSSMAQTVGMNSLAYHPKTNCVLLRGNAKADELGVVAYWNEETKQSFLNVLWLPEMEGKVFQLWADVDGEMISLGILDPTQAPFAPIEFKTDAESLNITIEPEGGSDHPTVTDLVSSIPI